MNTNSIDCLTKFEFPVGYHTFHRDKNINFQLNRWHSLGYWSKEDCQSVGQDVVDTGRWKPVMIDLAEEMESEGRLLAASIAYRAAEFYLNPRAPDKIQLYNRFHDSFYTAVEGEAFERVSVPYGSGVLPALRFHHENPKGTVVLHGGLDSFMEEFLSSACYLLSRGYEVILFDGPGQGAALRRSSLYMTHEWEKPVSAVLDYLELSAVTLVGLSLGGYLALRAAAFDERITRVVAYDVFLYDQHGSGLQGAIYRLFLKYPSLYNWVANAAMSRSVTAEQVVSQWMFITNSSTPAEWNAQVEHYSVSDIAAQVQQDVLLLAGAEDHMIPFAELEKNKNGLVNARSVTTRVFTSEEHAQNHCQVGNIRLALDVITQWMDKISSGG